MTPATRRGPRPCAVPAKCLDPRQEQADFARDTD